MAVLDRFLQLTPKLILLGLLGVATSAINAQTLIGLTVAWIPNPEPDVAGYYIYYGPRSGAYTNRIKVSGRETASVRLDLLVAGAPYYLAMTAYNLGGIESLPTSELVYSNSPPVISAIMDQFLREDTASGSLYFNVSDAESPAKDLRVTARSWNPALIPNNQILLDGISSQRSLVIVPQLN